MVKGGLLVESSHDTLGDFLKDTHVVHIIGVSGTLMAPFACFLKSLGLVVTGSDISFYPPMGDVLRAHEIITFEGYKKEHLLYDGKYADKYIVGNVISKNNPEIIALSEMNIAFYAMPHWLEAYILPYTRNIVVAGTHGKTTTSSLVTYSFREMQHPCSFLIGGVAVDLPVSFFLEKNWKNQKFVLEGDEYDTAFWDKTPKFSHYRPDYLILTSIEYDHADIYPDIDAIVKVFELLCARVTTCVIACTDYPYVRHVIKFVQCSVITYGMQMEFEPDVLIADYKNFKDFSSFKIISSKIPAASISLKMLGRHNALNASACYILNAFLGYSLEKLQQSFLSFQGVRRRQEVRGERFFHNSQRHVLIVEDFAHHPTALKVTLESLAEKYPDYYRICAFEPRSATSRRKVFQEAYTTAFASASAIGIASPFDQTHIPTEDQFSSEQLLKDLYKLKPDRPMMLINTQNFQLFFIWLYDGLMKAQERKILIIICSNGSFGGLSALLLKELHLWEDKI